MFDNNSVKSSRHSRSGVSPVIATTIIMAITVTLGLTLYSFVNSQTNTATQSFAEEVTDYLNYRNDRFVVTDLSFKTNGCGASLNSFCITAHVFNNGDKPVTISQISFGKDSASNMSPYCIVVGTSGPINSHTMASVSFYGPAGNDNSNCTGFPNGGLTALNQPAVYYAKIVADSGSYQSYFEKFN